MVNKLLETVVNVWFTAVHAEFWLRSFLLFGLYIHMKYVFKSFSTVRLYFRRKYSI